MLAAGTPGAAGSRDGGAARQVVHGSRLDSNGVPPRVLSEDKAATVRPTQASRVSAGALGRAGALGPAGSQGANGRRPGAHGAHLSTSYQKGVPAMDVLVRFERSWSIQDALDQHAALAEQREVLIEIGQNRLRVRQTQLSFAELEAEDALEVAKNMSPFDATDPQRTLMLASRVRATVRDLRLAQRLRESEQQLVDEHIMLAEAEIEKSRQEMAMMKEVIDDKSLVVATDEVNVQAKVVGSDGKPASQKYNYCCNCKVGGHGTRFSEYFLERPDWRVYPHQKWFQDEKGNEYHCPLGKKLVNFADESHFSRVAMYLKGRAWLEEKTKVLDIGCGYIPETYIIEGGQWKDGKMPPPDDQAGPGPWFVKEADRNWGTSVHCCLNPSECMGLVKPDSLYVVQQHIQNPLLMEDGRKSHIKFYVLLVGYEDGSQWKLYTYKDGYLSISPNKWSPNDISKETQVTIIRSERIGTWPAWPEAYPKCKEGVAKVIGKAVKDGKLEGRLGKKQFEIFSADFIVDTSGAVWMFEFNMSPVLKDAKDSPVTNDADMVRSALSIVQPYEGGSEGLWDLAGEFFGEPPVPKQPLAQAPPAADAVDTTAADGEVPPMDEVAPRSPPRPTPAAPASPSFAPTLESAVGAAGLSAVGAELESASS